MFNRRDLPECRHTVGSLVGSEVTVVSAASVCYPFLLVPPAKGPYTPPTRLSASNRRASCQFYRQADANDEAAKQRQATAKAWHKDRLFKKGHFCFCFICKSRPTNFQKCMTVTISHCCGWATFLTYLSHSGPLNRDHQSALQSTSVGSN